MAVAECFFLLVELRLLTLLYTFFRNVLESFLVFLNGWFLVLNLELYVFQCFSCTFLFFPDWAALGATGRAALRKSLKCVEVASVVGHLLRAAALSLGSLPARLALYAVPSARVGSAWLAWGPLGSRRLGSDGSARVGSRRLASARSRRLSCQSCGVPSTPFGSRL